MRKINLSAIIKNTTGYEHKVFDFDFDVKCKSHPSCSLCEYLDCASNCSDWDMIKATLQDTISKEPNCVLFNSNVEFWSTDELIINDPEGEIKVDCIVNGEYRILIDENAFRIYSYTSEYRLRSTVTAKECALILNKIDKNGLLVYVKDYLGMRENELKQLQALGEGYDKNTIERMASLIQHVSSIKHWLYLNNYN